MLSGSNDLTPGVTFGGYVVRELIGRGGMASVYRAEHVLLEKPVALKVMDRSLLASPIALSRFLREGRAAAAIKHPNVVDINDVGVHEDVPYLVMELLRGRDLAAHLLQNRQLDNAAAVRVALPVIAALHTAHSSGVVHRDIKPSNIFMSLGPDAQIVPKVLDFGISKMAFDRATIERAATPQNQIIGTPQYLPPEALHGVGEMGPLSDQYSLGVVLYQCVTGRTPFTGETLLALLEALSRGIFEPPRALMPSVSPALEGVILRALSASPSDRFPSIREMGRALIELAAQRTQVVWRQSFATPAHGHDASTAAGVDLPNARAAPSGDFTRTSASARGPARWRSAGLGLALVLGGALAATSWSALVAEPELSVEAAPGARAPAEPASPAGASFLPSAPVGLAAPAAAPAPGAPAAPAGSSAPARRADDAVPTTRVRGLSLALPSRDPEGSAPRQARAHDTPGKASERTAKAKKGRGAKGAKARRTAASGSAQRQESSRSAGTGPDESRTSGDAPERTALEAAALRGPPPGGPPPGGRAPDPSRRSPLPGGDGVVRGANGAPLLD